MSDIITSLSVNAPRTLVATVWKNCNYVSLWKVNKMSTFSEKPYNFDYHSNLNKYKKVDDKRILYFDEVYFL